MNFKGEFVETSEKAHRAIEFLEQVIKQYGISKIIVANSFGKDSMVVFHLARQVNPNITCFFVSTIYKPQETLDLAERVIREWGLVRVQDDEVFPRDQMGKVPLIKFYSYKGEIPDREYENNPESCCDRLKVEPFHRALKETGVTAFITGLRRTEGPTRENYQPIEQYSEGIVRISPLIGESALDVALPDWTELDIWKYTATHEIPVNALYREGYRSIGCAPCSKPGGKSERDSRWQGTNRQGGECGIHIIKTQ